MTNPFENSFQRSGDNIDSEQTRFEIIQGAQIELIQRAGGDKEADKWITDNSERFREIIGDPKSDLIERLANEATREEALKEIQSKFYH